jgi:hypothetical protein
VPEPVAVLVPGALLAVLVACQETEDPSVLWSPYRATDS